MRIVGVRPPETVARGNRRGYAFVVPARTATAVGVVIATESGDRFRVTRVERFAGTDLRPLDPGDYLVGLVDAEPLPDEAAGS